MITVLTVILTIILISRAIEEGFKIPAPLSLIVLSYFGGVFFGDMFSISTQKFSEILYLMLPIILLPDILNLSFKELKSNAYSIFYLAFIAVIFSIALAVFIGPWLLDEYDLSFGMLIALFTMLMATDAITVSSIFSKFSLPQKLKVYAESESLFNDVTALILFYFVALPLLSGEVVTFTSLNIVLLKVLFFSLLLGILLGYVGYIAVKFLTDTIEQFIIIYLVVVIAFLTAEHLEISGILAIVASAMSFKLFLKKELDKPTVVGKHSVASSTYHNRFESLIDYLNKVPAITKKEFRHFKKEAYFVGIFANAVVFVVMAQIFDFTLLQTYAKEIITIFVLTTLIRFIFVSGLVVGKKQPFRWSGVLTFSGIKGGLAIIMVHTIPVTFEYKGLFTAVVIGHVILSTFLYTAVLIFLMHYFKTAFEKDQIFQNTLMYKEDAQAEQVADTIKDILERDTQTGVFNEIISRRILNRELQRSKRYKLELSLLMLGFGNSPTKSEEESLEEIKNILLFTQDQLRNQDILGKISYNRFLIIAVNTPLSGATVLAQRLKEQFDKEYTKSDDIRFDVSITCVEATDEVEDLEEKLEDALNRADSKNENCNIEIET